MKKLLVVGVIVLFLGLAIAPSINANISKTSLDDELVEITTEICGLDGGKHTVRLTKEEAEEVKQLIDDIQSRLDEVETREETVEIFNEAIIELDKYGLLGGLSVKQAQRLITGRFHNLFEINLLKGMPSRYLIDNMANAFCLIMGEHQNIIDMRFLVNNIITFLINLILSIEEIIGTRLMLEYILSGLVAIWWIKFFRSLIHDFDIGTSIYFPKQTEGNILSIGILGKKTMSGRITGGFKEPIFASFGDGSHYLGIIGFTGLQIRIWDWYEMNFIEHKFLGSALFVNLVRG